MATYRETIERVMSGDFADATEEERNESIRNVIQVCSVAAGAVAIQPFPFVDVALITPIQIAMVQAIGRIHGHKLDRKSVVEILASFGASIVAQNVMLAAVKFVPFFGWIVGVSMAYALTWAIGEVADHYFRHGRGVPTSELQDMFKRIYRDKRAEKEEEVTKDPTLKERLQQLNDAFESGLIDDDEFQAKKEQILAGH